MKPRTKLQFEVVDLAKHLYPISKKEKEWAYKECLPHLAYANKKSAFCLDCGESFSLDLIKRKTAICPHCETKLKVEVTRKTTNHQVNYFAITDVFQEFQIVRNFELIAHYKKGNPVKYFPQEIMQYWIQPDLKMTLFGLNHHTQGCCDSWGGAMEIRTTPRYFYHKDKYDVYPRMYHPDSVFKPEYRKIGINHKLKGLTLLEAITKIPNQPILETLIKANYYCLLGVDGWKLRSRWPSLKICLRNKYKINDASIYLDYLDLLEYFKKDLLNSVYVCPKNLKKEHDKLVAKKRVIQELEAREREKLDVIRRQKKLEKAVEEYGMRNAMFFDVEFKKGAISIRLLKTIDEFKEEGDELKHCVFANEYYLKENSLIFSARVNGKRTETIELVIDKFKIEQSRGLSNNPSKYNKEIIALMKQSIPKIKSIIKKTQEPKQILQSA